MHLQLPQGQVRAARRVLETLGEMKGPKQLVVYQESRHTVGNVPSTVLGPNPQALTADWMHDRLSGKPLKSSRWFVEASGNTVKSAF